MRGQSVEIFQMIGEVYGNLRCIGVTKTETGRKVVCICTCGNIQSFSPSQVRTGKSRSCGCKIREALYLSKVTHGHAHKNKRSSEYRIWYAMKDRCHNPRCDKYPGYGGRGITVCDRWRADFSAFLADVGPRPSLEHTLDRINNDGNYEPGNCRWATRKTQARNRRGSRYVVVRGERLPLAEACERYNQRYGLVIERLNWGWAIEEALTAPARKVS